MSSNNTSYSPTSVNTDVLTDVLPQIVPYVKVEWENGQSPALNAENLLRSEQALEDLLGKSNTETGSLQDVVTRINDVSNIVELEVQAREKDITELDTKLNTNVTNLSNSIDSEASVRAQTDEALNARISNEESVRKIVVEDLTTKLNSKANTSHKHQIEDVDNLKSTLDGKANSVHKHVLSDVTDYVAPVIPKKVSDLDNDLNYLTSIPSEYVTESELSNKNYATKAYVDSVITPGGEVNLDNYYTKEEVDDLIPKNISEFTNDKKYITESEANSTFLKKVDKYLIVCGTSDSLN